MDRHALETRNIVLVVIIIIIIIQRKKIDRIAGSTDGVVDQIMLTMKPRTIHVNLEP